ncbi:MAG: hypothetical protein COA58_11250 [Bacteroidetes bacterium]|nr:MAG: hypothetical protein COA58_11250 [Bacteroidota bacterium]
MKNFLQGFAVLTHPIFLPLFSLIIYAPLVAGQGQDAWILASVWIGFVYLILPLVYFKVVRKINFANPSLTDRKSIFRTYLLVNIGFALVNVFLMSEYISFFLGASLLHLLLRILILIDMKASWHTAVWSFLVTAGLMVLYNFQFVNLPVMIASAFVVLLLVYATRYTQKVHSHLELIMGVSVGAISSLPILFF